MSKRILVDAVYPEESRVVVLENKKIQEYDYEVVSKPQVKGNIYLAKITRVEPSLQAAFIDYGNEKHGFLPFSEIHPSYFHIPVSDRQEKSKNKSKDTDDIGDNFIAIAPPDLSDVIEDEEILPVSQEQEDDNKIANLDIQAENAAITSEEQIDEVDEFGDEEENSFRKLYQKYRIQEVIKRNQVILVQAIKEERGNKGASFTSFISLAGRYCVLMPNSNRQGGISRRIIDLEKRKKLKKIIDSLAAPEGVSVIIRTAGDIRTKGEIKRDYDYLVRLWNSIREHTIVAKAPAFIHAESDVTKRAIRDLFDNRTAEILVQGEAAYNVIKEFTKKLVPNGENKIKQYKNKTPLFYKFNIEEQIASLYNQTIPLESGGYLVMNATEALTSIDVNSGKSTSERNIEETAIKTNIEAAKEVARQVKLRDISGLIVIDFIDMVEFQNRKTVERVLRDAVKSDRARIQVGNISSFGLVEMSRQRLRSSFSETKMVVCNHCNGKGKVRDPEANALMVIRTIENEVCSNEFGEAIVYAHIDVVLYILNFKRDHIKNIEDKFNVKIQFQREFDISVDSYSIERIPRTERQDELRPTVDEEEIHFDDIYEEDDDIDEEPKSNIQYDNGSEKQNDKREFRRKNHFRRGSYKKFGRRTSNSYKRRNNDNNSNAQNNNKKDSWWSKLFG